MCELNYNLKELEKLNLFTNVSKKISEFQKQNPNLEIVSLGIGDVSRPIIKPVIDAMLQAVNDLSDMESFRGYGAYYGYDFLKRKILESEYEKFNFSMEEIYVSNGTKTDSTSILELFDINSEILITDPMYPIYRDGAKCLNRKINILSLNEENEFLFEIPNVKYDIIYICSPNNPIGIAYTKEQLKEWVDYAVKHQSIILYDNVYASFITSKNVPHSIYEIDGAKNVAIEFKSFSKNASFTGVRCSYYIIPNDIRDDINLLWRKRTINRFNGADYIAQRGAEATYLPESKKQIQENINYYMSNVKYLKREFELLGFKTWGGKDSPFIWVKIKENSSSWEIFDIYLKKLNIIIIPGIIFGSKSDKYFRVSGLGQKEDIIKAVERLKKYYEKEI